MHVLVATAVPHFDLSYECEPGCLMIRTHCSVAQLMGYVHCAYLERDLKFWALLTALTHETRMQSGEVMERHHWPWSRRSRIGCHFFSKGVVLIRHLETDVAGTRWRG